MVQQLTQPNTQQELTDQVIIDRVLAGEVPLYELLIRRYNQRLYRVVRAVLRDDSETEDVMQEAYVRAFEHLADFEGRSSFSTWLIRIAVHEALARRNRASRLTLTDFEDAETTPAELLITREGSPEMHAANAQTRDLLEKAILALPESYRVIMIMRDVEEISTSETAVALDLTEENVKVRLHRARAMVRRELFSRAGATSASAFQFHAVRCDRITTNVMQRIATPFDLASS